ncbi:MAG: thioredoxin [Bacilli bacterium]|jgi:thioredoxin 1|nr:thioredoxin [Bacilli bacterium]
MEIKNKQEFEEKVLNSNKKVLVDFYADWCGPCKMLAPILEGLKNDYEIYKVNVDNLQELAIKYAVMTIPTLIVFENGEIKEKTVGFKNENQIKDLMD